MRLKIFFAPLVFIAGALLMRYTVQVTNFTGKIDFAEKYLGGGIGAGTYSWWRIVGFALCVIAVLWLFNKLPHAPASITPTGLVLMLLQ